MKHNYSYYLVFLGLFASVMCAHSLQGQDVNYTERHTRLRKAAADIVLGLGDRKTELSISPRLEICNEGHYHFRVGRHGIYCDSFWELSGDATNAQLLSSNMMDARLEIEWLWKGIPANQRTFWTPYIVEAANAIAALEKEVEAQPEMDSKAIILLFPTRLEAIWERGATEFARLQNLELKLERDPGIACAAAEPVTVRLVTRLPNRVIRPSHIEWSPAAPVWRAMIDGREPTSYQTVSIGGAKEVHIGAIYYYRFVINGRATKERLAPEIPRKGGTIELPFTE